MSTEQEEVSTKASKQVTKVRMEDKREVEFVGKRKQLKEALFDADGHWTGVRLDYINGKTLEFVAPSPSDKLKNGKYSLDQFAAHGALQKFGDATAGYKEDELEDAIIAAERTMERVNEGEWAVEREGGSFAGTSILILALVEKTGKTYQALKDWLKTKTKEQKDAMRNSDTLRPIVQKLEAERAAKSAHVDTQELFAELDTAA